MSDYDITQIDVDEHDTTNGEYNSLVMIDSTHAILAYQGGGNYGIIKTFLINGSHELSTIDSFTYLEGSIIHNSLVKVDDTHYMLAYSTATKGYIKTFSIDGNYDISLVDTYEYLGTATTHNSLAKLDGTHYMLAYQGPDSDGFIKTFTIDANADNIAEVDVLEQETDFIDGQSSLVAIDSTHAILAYQGPDYDGFIKTFSCDAAGTNIAQVAVLEYDTAQGGEPSMVKINATHFAVAYNGGGAVIKTFSIDGSYENITMLKSLKHSSGNGRWNSIVMIDSTHFILSYMDCVGGYGLWIKTFSMDGSYELTELDSLEHNASFQTYSPTSLVKLEDAYYMLAYQGADYDGFVKTFSLDIASDTGTGAFFQFFN